MKVNRDSIALAAILTLAASSCSDEDFYLPENVETYKYEQFYLNPSFAENPETRATIIESSKVTPPPFAWGDTIRLVDKNGPVINSEGHYVDFVMRRFEVVRTDSLVMLTDTTKQDGKSYRDLFHYQGSVPTSVDNKTLRLERVTHPRQMENNSFEHLKYMIPVEKKLTRKDLYDEQDNVNDVHFDIRPYAIAKIILSGFYYAIWPGGNIELYVTTGKRMNDEETLLSVMKLGDSFKLTDELKISKKTRYYNANGNQIEFKAPDPSKITPFLNVPEYDESNENQDNFIKATGQYIKTDMKLIAYTIIPANTELNQGLTIKVVVNGGWSNDTYVWTNKLTAGVITQVGKIYEFNFDEKGVKPFVAYEIFQNSGIKIGTDFYKDSNGNIRMFLQDGTEVHEGDPVIENAFESDPIIKTLNKNGSYFNSGGYFSSLVEARKYLEKYTKGYIIDKNKNVELILKDEYDVIIQDNDIPKNWMTILTRDIVSAVADSICGGECEGNDSIVIESGKTGHAFLLKKQPRLLEEDGVYVLQKDNKWEITGSKSITTACFDADGRFERFFYATIRVDGSSSNQNKLKSITISKNAALPRVPILYIEKKVPVANRIIPWD